MPVEWMMSSSCALPSILFLFCRLLVFWPDSSVNILAFSFSLPIFYFRSLFLFHTVSYICCLTQSLFSDHISWFYGDIFHFLGLFKRPIWLLLGLPGWVSWGLCPPCREDSRPEQVCCVCSGVGARFPGWVTWDVCLYSVLRYQLGSGSSVILFHPLCLDWTKPRMTGLVTLVVQHLLERGAPPTTRVSSLLPAVLCLVLTV